MNNDKNKLFLEMYDCYACPIFVVGDINVKNSVTISATIDKKELIIDNNKTPKWMYDIYKNKSNTLIITDFDKITLEEQRLFIDIICDNRISSSDLPKLLKIIIVSKTDCALIPEIRECIEVCDLR